MERFISLKSEGAAVAKTSHAATDSAIGYYHQGLYALVVLLDAGDGARVSVETADDVTLEDGGSHLHQLKHSLDPSSSFTIKTDGLWKTVKAWCDRTPAADEILVLATCAPLPDGSDLAELTRPGVARSVALLKSFDDEASRVRTERDAPLPPGKEKPYAKRAPGCEAWLGLTRENRQSLLDKMLLVPSSFTAANVPVEVAKRLKCVLADVRARLVERLIEWWDRQVVLSLLEKRQRWLSKTELLAHIEQLIIEHSSRGLPDDVAGQLPPDINAEMTGKMVRQIELVAGGPARIRRAAVARWRVRTQRERWLLDDFSIAAELDQFDGSLVERWQDRFEPMQYDCRCADETVCSKRGLEILDWSHQTAHTEVPPIRPLFTAEFLVQGTYQQLADEERVGWHPNYQTLLAAPDFGGT